MTVYFSQQKKFEDTVNINYRLPIKAYYRICTLRLQSTEILLYLAFTNELNVVQKEKNIDE
jgi:hypothetical protein